MSQNRADSFGYQIIGCLKVTPSTGTANGDCKIEGHEGEIDVYGWRFGVTLGSALGSSTNNLKRVFDSLEVTKIVDPSTTGLWKIIENNASLSTVRLTVTTMDEGSMQPIFQITLNGATLTNILLEPTKELCIKEKLVFTFTGGLSINTWTEDQVLSSFTGSGSQ